MLTRAVVQTLPLHQDAVFLGLIRLWILIRFILTGIHR
jgi:hypothetical protein